MEVNHVYSGLKSCIFVETDDLWITGRSWCSQSLCPIKLNLV